MDAKNDDNTLKAAEMGIRGLEEILKVFLEETSGVPQYNTRGLNYGKRRGWESWGWGSRARNTKAFEAVGR